jgi:hypothetical protein
MLTSATAPEYRLSTPHSDHPAEYHAHVGIGQAIVATHTSSAAFTPEWSSRHQVLPQKDITV